MTECQNENFSAQVQYRHFIWAKSPQGQEESDFSLNFYSYSFYVYLRGCIVYQNTAVGRTIHEPKYM